MKFKKGDIIKASETAKYSSMHPWISEYEVKDIANGDLYSDKYYVLADQDGKRTYHDYHHVDNLFRISLQHVLKNL